mgnify:FL=1
MDEEKFKQTLRDMIEDVLKPYVKEMVTFEADRIGLELVKRFKTCQYSFIDGNNHRCLFVEEA